MQAQNNVRLLAANGALFKAYLNDRPLNNTPQASLLIEKTGKDTLYLKLEFENSARYGITLYLLDKGQPTAQKEFNYTLRTNKNRIDVEFTGLYDIIKLPESIVPHKIKVDTIAKYNNVRLGRFCEIKDNKPVYYNNLPKQGACTVPMPDEFLSYTNILILKIKSADEKYEVVENVLRNNCLSVAQLNTLLAYIDYEIDKLKLVKTGYSSLTDPDAQKELEKSFKLEVSLNELRDFFKHAPEYKTRAGSTCIQASPEAEIKSLNERLAAISNDAERYATLKKLSPGYCFSLSQLMNILPKFMHDREKLQAAKLLYPNCIDKGNYGSIAGLFSYEQSVAELKDFIEKQKQ